ncbi:391_t:CDS:10 [Dentiscutata erythropus]|uniref:391_t:CDS:1 n=1 Tax=Dentiscutata erythropus TaxID=1348616 RepID=A0A9N9DWM5_9GLOM|nr:391_t:CDS:10 [Dentiscutata erythropus]
MNRQHRNLARTLQTFVFHWILVSFVLSSLYNFTVYGLQKSQCSSSRNDMSDYQHIFSYDDPFLTKGDEPFTTEPFTTEPFTTEVVDDSIHINIIDKNLLSTLQTFLRSENLYDVNPKISADELFLILPQLKNYVEQDFYQIHSPLKRLVDWLEKGFDSRFYQLNNMIDNHEISFKYLWYLFPSGSQVYAQLNGKVCGLRVKKSKYETSYGTQQFVITDGHEFVYSDKTWYISHFVGVLNITKLPVVPLQKECAIRDELVKRGKKFEMYANGHHYLQYSGNFFHQFWFRNTYYRGDGRIMVDASTFGKIKPNYDMGLSNFNLENFGYNFKYNSQPKPFNMSENSSKRKVKEEELYMCSPTFFGFSFTAKLWGQFYVDQVDEIKFDDDAFDNLIMDTNKKDIIMSLVKSELSGGLDFISGKGGGCIFLLHGPPGVGKTLTAEAISEYLHRPLYAVSVGELGVTPKELEKKLNEILEVGRVWNAIILIDEVDIFLEQRSKNDVNRNALRISLILKYYDLDESARAQIWRAFLDRADGKDKSQVDIDKLKQLQFNGREIKSAVRLAKALATISDPDAIITAQHLEKILNIFAENLD